MWPIDVSSRRRSLLQGQSNLSALSLSQKPKFQAIARAASASESTSLAITPAVRDSLRPSIPALPNGTRYV